MIYADEDFYKNSYLCGREPTIKSGFLFYAKNASKTIDEYTFNRITETTEDISLCCCEVAEILYENEHLKREKGVKSSEKIGSYSVSYESSSDSMDNLSKNIKQAVIKYLGNTGLCYRGV